MAAVAAPSRLRQINLSAGAPDVDTAPAVALAGVRAISEGRTRYTPAAGIPELRDAVVEKLARDNGIAAERDNVFIGAGAKHVVFVSLLSILTPGAEVILVAPHYAGYRRLVELAGGTVVTVSTESAGGFRLDPKALERAITNNTRVVILNSPSNPTGVVYSKDEISAIVDIVERHPSVFLLSDELYEDFVYDGRTHFSPAAGESPARRMLTINGVSKSHGMTGWRIGYAAGPADVISRAVDASSALLNCACSVSQWAAVEALSIREPVSQETRARFQAQRNDAYGALSQVPGLSVQRPEGAIYQLVNFDGLIGRRLPSGQLLESEEQLVAYLRDELHVAVTPGSRFAAPNSMRITFAIPRRDLEEGLARVVATAEATTDNY